jgi:hypothetical protein
MTAPAFETASSATDTSGTATTLTVDKPASTAEGDLLWALVQAFKSGNDISVHAWSSSGWAVDQHASYGSGNNRRSAVLWKVAGGSEPSTYDFTFGIAASLYGGILRISGAHATTPLAAAPAAATGASSVPNPPASGTVASGDYLAIAAAAHSNASETPPAGYDERVDASNVEIATLSLAGVTSEDPGTITTATAWSAYTYLVAPPAAEEGAATTWLAGRWA